MDTAAANNEFLAELAEDLKKLENFVTENSLLFIDIKASKYYEKMDSTTVDAICKKYHCEKVKSLLFWEVKIKIKQNSILIISISEILETNL